MIEIPTFTGPVTKWAWPTGNRLFDRIKIDRGSAVVKVNGHYQEQEVPYLGDIEGLVDGVDYFLGGHTYTIDQATADALTADGFGPGVSTNYGLGSYRNTYTSEYAV